MTMAATLAAISLGGGKMDQISLSKLALIQFARANTFWCWP
jgi:hypothetical protein